MPNRVLFMDRLETALSRAARHQRRLAVVFLDLDRFKLVNDSLGHATGDHLLEIVADRLKTAVRPSDTVARFGGDEFVMLCDEVTDEADAVEVAARLTDVLSQPIVLAEGEIFISASLGVALSGQIGDSAASLLRDADTAMYKAKERGRARIEIFDQQSRAEVLQQMHMRSELHRALERGELRLNYQPIVELASGSLAGVEALIRWQHPDRGLLLPGEFLTMAEEGGLIVPIGLWVLEESCRQAVRWETERRRQGIGTRSVSVSVNLSPRQLIEPSFIDEVAEVLRSTKIDPGALWLELTEGAFVADTEPTLDVLGGLRDLRIHLSIDDFGTGYASLGYLRRFPVEALKIDRSFVAGLGRGVEDTAIVGSVVTLARSLGLTCIAEGVERLEQLVELQNLGCELRKAFSLVFPCPRRSSATFSAMT